MNKTILSILVPTHNMAKYLLICMQSIIRQILPGMEIIVIENNSIDDTPQILSELESKYIFIKVIYLHETISLLESRKLALEFANGQYVMYVDSDDVLYENAISTLVNNISAFDYPDMLVYRFTPFDEKKQYDESPNIFASNSPYMLSENDIYIFKVIVCTSEKINNIWIKCIKKNLINYSFLNSYFNYTYMEDKVHTLLFLLSSNSIIYIPISLYKYRKHCCATTKKVTFQWIIEFLHYSVFSLNMFAPIMIKEDIHEVMLYQKVNFSKLMCWWIGQTIRKDIDVNNELMYISRFIKENCSFLLDYKGLAPKYKIVTRLFVQKNYILLKIICKLVVIIRKQC